MCINVIQLCYIRLDIVHVCADDVVKISMTSEFRSSSFLCSPSLPSQSARLISGRSGISGRQIRLHSAKRRHHQRRQRKGAQAATPVTRKDGLSLPVALKGKKNVSCA